MSDARRDKDFILDIQEAVHRILDYTVGMDWEAYIIDYKTQDAVVRNLEIIGEAAKSISDDLCNQHPAIPWKDMVGTRDRLVHHYFGINQEIVWQIVRQDLPPLLKQIEALLGEV